MKNYQDIIEKYPNLFENEKNKDSKTPISLFSIECNLGWYDLINNVCHAIDQHEKNIFTKNNTDYEPVKFTQVKEKFGGLRIYYTGGDDFVEGLVYMAESFSYNICEVCGNKGKVNKGSWVATLCDNCEK